MCCGRIVARLDLISDFVNLYALAYSTFLGLMWSAISLQTHDVILALLVQLFVAFDAKALFNLFGHVANGDFVPNAGILSPWSPRIVCQHGLLILEYIGGQCQWARHMFSYSAATYQTCGRLTSCAYNHILFPNFKCSANFWFKFFVQTSIVIFNPLTRAISKRHSLEFRGKHYLTVDNYARCRVALFFPTWQVMVSHLPHNNFTLP